MTQEKELERIRSLVERVDTQNQLSESRNTNAAKQIMQKTGKFKDADALHKAYKELESEFTKRNQELSKCRELVRGLEAQLAVAQERIDNILSDESFRDKAVLDEGIFAKAVERFLNARRLSDSVPLLTSGMGQAAASVVRKPKTLAEASKLAAQLLR